MEQGGAKACVDPGVVRIAADASFVMADIPGLIVGAAEGAGLGAQFLRHLSRTSLLLHLVDVAPEDASDPIDNALAIESELMQYSEALAERPIWIALSKVDQLEAEELETMLEAFAETCNYFYVRLDARVHGCRNLQC